MSDTNEALEILKAEVAIPDGLTVEPDLQEFSRGVLYAVGKIEAALSQPEQRCDALQHPMLESVHAVVNHAAECKEQGACLVCERKAELLLEAFDGMFSPDTVTAAAEADDICYVATCGHEAVEHIHDETDMYCQICKGQESRGQYHEFLPYKPPATLTEAVCGDCPLLESEHSTDKTMLNNHGVARHPFRLVDPNKPNALYHDFGEGAAIELEDPLA